METQNQITAWYRDSHSHKLGWAGDVLLLQPKPACLGRPTVKGIKGLELVLFCPSSLLPLFSKGEVQGLG